MGKKLENGRFDQVIIDNTIATRCTTTCEDRLLKKICSFPNNSTSDRNIVLGLPLGKLDPTV